MNDDPELARWQRDWQAQHELPIDFDRLRHRAMKTRRREQFFTALELITSLVTLVLATRAFFQAAPDSVLRLILPLLAAVIIIGTARNVVLRYRQWQASLLDVASLVALERLQMTRRIRYWRTSAWAVTALWSALAIVAIADPAINPAAQDRHAAWFLSLTINSGVVIATAVCAYWIKRRADARRDVLDKLESVPDDES